MPEKAVPSGRTYAAHYVDVHVLIRRPGETGEGQLLMGKRTATQRVFPLMWQFPSGLLETGEPVREGAAREVREETGLTIAPGDLDMVHVMHHRSEHDESERVAFFFEAVKWEGELGNPEPDKCEGWQWVDCPGVWIPAPTPLYLLDAVYHINNGTPYSDRWDGWAG